MLYIKLDTQEYPLTMNMVLAHFPNTSFTDGATEFEGFAKVQPVASPAFNHTTQSLAEGAPVLVDDIWHQAWIVSDLPSAEVTARLVTLKARLAADIDSLVFQVYEKPNILAREYLAREAEAQAYKDAGYSGTIGPYFQGFITESGMLPAAACDLILSQAENFRAAEPELANLRMAKYSVSRATTEGDALSLYTATINRIKEIAATL
jgi:hypothetical protein